MKRDEFFNKAGRYILLLIIAMIAAALGNKVVTGSNCSACSGNGICKGETDCNNFQPVKKWNRKKINIRTINKKGWIAIAGNTFFEVIGSTLFYIAIQNMENRIFVINGTMTFDSKTNEGFKANIHIPI